MEFLVQFVVGVPDGVAEAEIRGREEAEAVAAARLVRDGHLVRLWKPPTEPGETRILGLYRAENEVALRRLLEALPLYDWMTVALTPLAAHPNDPARSTHDDRGSLVHDVELPGPRLRLVYRLEATVGAPIELGDTPQGHRRLVPLVEGRFMGPELSGSLLPAGSADWQTIRPDGVAIGEIRYTLRTDAGAHLFVYSHSVRHGPAEVLERLARGDDVPPTEYTFRTSTQIETSAPQLHWLNNGVFVSVGARRPKGVVYDVYLVE